MELNIELKVSYSVEDSTGFLLLIGQEIIVNPRKKKNSKEFNFIWKLYVLVIVVLLIDL